ncbi:MAG TPA: pyrroline-5-carboxylate reductase dimerization domain-containing protein, partial [Parvularculaceae bacterium]|nr:pyrroline-5-carboxylate reductase dimerization domain-containing protein [Parvularculaceae bacterium]
AQRLARATAVGAGALLDADPRSAAEMRKAVTSPGGATAAALALLDGDDAALRTLIKKGVSAAAKRASELTD